MKRVLQLEEMLLFAASIAGLWYQEAVWWWYLALLLAPDIGMLGYLAGNKAGAFTYNFLHHKGIAALVLVVGIFSGSALLINCGILLIGHSSMDRMFGFGLKYDTGFNQTHLGTIGNKRD